VAVPANPLAEETHERKLIKVKINKNWKLKEII
jgi:hypothetical protein